MSTFTENYDFIKPDNEDYYDIQDFNENMDAIDAQLAQAEQKVAAIQASIATAEETLAAINKKLGTPPDGQSISSLLQNGGSVIRSIQYVVYTAPKSPSYGGTVTIQTVNLEKTFIITERLNNNFDSLLNFSYTLSSNAITVKHTGCDVDTVKIGFWVVEFV
ncbi:hypothetical protein DW773_06350 [Firmicutes bacterium AM29-6AC]|mgnify:FL=1|jgi:hypothetical protein|uniref:H-type lectin domain-containing protein n=1 Tax=Anaerotignum faecicola TaxID=2358141 RepID=A0A401LFX6_9FIRM|nr:hypothetical protein [Anaerotignum faecicola]RHR15244.1 hypothetical protein DWX47_06200 [Firmicutes bacterium AF19-2LB]RHT40814.1 hypothetical protein DW773_06350 [Firmicutes bacterium AM29-6AC]GCB30420.1 hypothetical protein KGMB03357_20810 [Anaerotignum faecicola]